MRRASSNIEKFLFQNLYCRYDPHATQFIHFSQVSDFLASLDPPLGIPKPNTVALVSFNLAISSGNKIHCLDILHALVKHVLGHVEETDTFKQLQVTFLHGNVQLIRLIQIEIYSLLRNKWMSNSRNSFQPEKNWKLFLPLVYGRGKTKQPERCNMVGENIYGRLFEPFVLKFIR